MSPDGSIVRKAVDEQDGRSRSAGLDRQAHSIDRDAIHWIVGAAGAEEPADLVGYWLRLALSIDADEEILGSRDRGVVTHPTRNLPQREAGSAKVRERVLKAEEIAGSHWRVKVEHASSNGRP